MANRFPLIVDSTNNNIKELPSGDNLDMTGSGFANLSSITPLSYHETYVAPTSSSNATTINCAAGNYFKHTLTENTTFTFSNPPSSGTGFSFILHLIQDSSARTVTWPGSVDWASATAPTISTGNGDDDFFVFATSDGGTIWYGFTAGQAMA